MDDRTGSGAAVPRLPRHRAFLLPAFDPFTLAPIGHRDHTIPTGRVGEVSRTAGLIAPMVVEDGQIIGTWGSEDGIVTLSPFTDLAPRTRRDIEDTSDPETTACSAPTPGRDRDLTRKNPRLREWGGSILPGSVLAIAD